VPKALGVENIKGNSMDRLRTLTLLVLLGVPAVTLASEDFAYAEIAKRYESTKLSEEQVAEAQMHGECLVGLKELNFRSSEEFDPVAEWTNYRSLSLLEQFPPCQVLVMMEVARAELLELMGEEE